MAEPSTTPPPPATKSCANDSQSSNGSGKTACFVLGMLSRVDLSLQALQALCICPTREIAIQNILVLRKMGKYTGISSECAVPISGGRTPISKWPPIMAQVLIGTPGTIEKMITFKKLELTKLKILVFDDADQLFAEDGFKDDSLRIMKAIEKSNSNCQVLMFSATFNDTVKNLITRIVDKEHNELFVKKEDLSLAAGAVFNLICDEMDEKLMSKIENHFGSHVTEVPERSVEDFKAALKEAGLI